MFRLTIAFALAAIALANNPTPTYAQHHDQDDPLTAPSSYSAPVYNPPSPDTQHHHTDPPAPQPHQSHHVHEKNHQSRMISSMGLLMITLVPSMLSQMAN